MLSHSAILTFLLDFLFSILQFFNKYGVFYRPVGVENLAFALTKIDFLNTLSNFVAHNHNSF